jgi:RNA polymerase sigma-70 factor (ECF subfamily)
LNPSRARRPVERTPEAVAEQAALLARCRAGDDVAWGELVTLHRRRVFNIAYRFTARHDAAEDLTQEIFLRVFRNLSKFETSADFSKWLSSVARNHCIDHYRSVRREKMAMVDDEHAYSSAPAATGDPSRAVEAGEARERLRVALAEIPVKLREAVILRDLMGLSYEEMADRLALPTGTVKSRINRGREELTQALRRTA